MKNTAEVKKHAPRDVVEHYNGSYTCGVCRAEVTRYSAPRAKWVHLSDIPPRARGEL